MSATQAPPSGSSGTGSGAGLTAGSGALLHTGWMKGDMANMRLIVRACGDATFRLSMLATTDNGATYVVVKQAASGVVSVDGGVTGYVNAAELDIPIGAEWNVQIWAVGGTLGYVYDWRVYYAGTH